MPTLAIATPTPRSPPQSHQFSVCYNRSVENHASPYQPHFSIPNYPLGIELCSGDKPQRAQSKQKAKKSQS
jgi:hypothetical protein